jgi:hypothetical protein
MAMTALAPITMAAFCAKANQRWLVAECLPISASAIPESPLKRPSVTLLPYPQAVEQFLPRPQVAAHSCALFSDGA